MKQLIKYKVLNCEGKVVHKVVEHDFPDFQEYEITLPVNGIPLTTTVAVTTQIMDHLDNTDKRSLMDDNDWHTIIDYWVHTPTKKKDPVKKQVAALAEVYLRDLQNGPQLFVDFLAVYAKMYKNIKSLPAEKQFTIVLDALGVGYEAQSEVYKRTISMLKGEDDSFNQRMLNHKNQNNGNQIQGSQGQA